FRDSCARNARRLRGVLWRDARNTRHASRGATGCGLPVRASAGLGNQVDPVPGAAKLTRVARHPIVSGDVLSLHDPSPSPSAMSCAAKPATRAGMYSTTIAITAPVSRMPYQRRPFMILSMPRTLHPRTRVRKGVGDLDRVMVSVVDQGAATDV